MSSDDFPQPLVDGFGREHRDLRISVTDRCNFRCTYCMPAEGMVWQPREHLLTFEEIERIARVCVQRFGFDSIRLTGGEPTVRARLPLLVEKLSALGVDLSMTTTVPRCRPRPTIYALPVSIASTSRSTRCGPTGSTSSPGATSSPACGRASVPPWPLGSTP